MKLSVVMLAFSTVIASAQIPTNSFPLWPEGAPDALGKAEKDTPTLTPFFPEPGKATGAAMVVCPGGGYGWLAPHEGKDYALWLNEHGIAVFVLKYRLGTDGYRHPAMLHDAARAVRLVRSKAGDWKLDAHKVGIMGSSAGGHLTSTLLTHFDSGKPDAADPIERESSRPDLGVLCYAVITMGPFTHGGSKANLLGKNPSEELTREVSNELHVTHETPPCFVWGTYEDNAVPIENSLQFVEALRKAKVPFDFHVYQKGGHGMGLGTRDWNPAKRHPWTEDLAFWLGGQGWAK